MRPLLVLVATFSLGGGLSCALSPAAPEAEQIAWDDSVLPPVADTAVPASSDQIIARFERFQTGLADFEIRAVARAIVEESDSNGFDWELVLAVIDTESSFNNFARSNVGALGLMQIMPTTGEMLAAELGLPWEGAETLFDPVVNVRLGTRYLAYLHAKYQVWDAALAAYNWGPGAIDRRLRRGDGLPVLYSRAVYARVEQQAGL
jgi:soluble lytic murein transglycosylase-like protein